MRKLLLVGWQSFCGNELLWIFFNDSFRYDNGGGVYLDFINSGYDKYKFSCTGLYCAAGLVGSVSGERETKRSSSVSSDLAIPSVLG